MQQKCCPLPSDGVGPLQTILEQRLHQSSLQFPPPRLSSLALSTVSKSWDETGKAIAFEKEAERQLQIPVCDHHDPSQPLVLGASAGPSSSSHSRNSPCALSFLATPLGTHKHAAALANFLKQYTTKESKRGGWIAQNNLRQGGFQNKMGSRRYETQCHTYLGNWGY